MNIVDWAVLDTPIGPFGMLAEGVTVWASGFSADVAVLRPMLPESRRDDEVVPCADLGAVSAAVRRYLGGDLGAIDGVALAWELDGFRDRRPGDPLGSRAGQGPRRGRLGRR